IAAAAEVQPSTLVRFAQQFGLDGFSSLQRLFRARLRERNSIYEDRLRVIREGGVGIARSTGILHGFIDAGHRSLAALESSIDPDTLERGVEILALADTIYLVAKRRSYPIVAYVAYAFGKLGVKFVGAGTASGIDDDLLHQARPRDAAFVV